VRPRTLRLTAFGPYKDTLTLDFDDLGDHGLFLMHGPTGAGKTTLLDAMSFALYGDASGGEREMRELRSDLAPDSAVARVEFEFTLGADRFRIERTPTQIRPGKKTPQQHAASIWRVGTGEPALLATGVREVDSCVYDLLGLKSEQFRQVVVLPQGQFRALLTASSQEREDILRALFDTAAFLRLEEKLKEASAQAQADVDRNERELQGVLNAYGVDTLLALEDRVTRQEEAVNTATTRERTAREAWEAARAAQDLANAEATLFEQYDDAVRQERAVAASASERDERARRLEAGRRAAQVASAEGQRRRLLDDLVGIESSHQSADEAHRAAQGRREAARNALNTEEGRNAERAAAAGRRDELRGLGHQVKRYENVAQTLARYEEERRAIEGRRARSAAALNELNLDALGREFTQADETARTLPQLQDQLSRTRQLKDSRQRFDDVQQDLLRAVTAEDKASRAAQDAELNWMEARDAHTKLRRHFLTQQAGLLAEELTPGAPCRVCGSTDHPAPASRSPEAPTQADVDAAEQTEEAAATAFRRAETLKQTAHAARRGLDGTLGELRAQLGSTADQPMSTLQAELNDLQNAVKAAERAAGAAQSLKEAYDAALEQAEQLRLALSEQETEHTRLSGLIESFQAQRADLAQLLPPGVHSTSSLNDLIIQAEGELQALVTAFENARSVLEGALQDETTALNALNGVAGELKAQRAAAQQVQAAFEEALATAGFSSEAAYQQASLPEDHLRHLADQVAADSSAVTQVRDRLAQTQRAVDGRTRPDVGAARQAFEAADTTRTEAIKAAQDARNALASWKGGVKKITDLEIQHADRTMASQRLIALAKAARGTTGQRVSFHRYVLGTFLDEVLELASHRLREMSRHRYELRRADDGKGGLELEVFDHYTSRARSAKSLSGGESFQAALSLALGLAEVVQQQAGGRYLETVFIDEGFGSLDPQALDLALDCLMDLQSSGRLVGVVSHVQELQQHIQARLEVTAGHGGSAAQFVVS
jgi:exonuclease SbcC